jgi:hypothetical protein
VLDILNRAAARPASLVIDGEPVAVAFRPNPRARRMILRLAARGDGIVVTLPPGTTSHAGLEFAARHAGWIRRQLAGRPQAAPLVPGRFVPVRGVEHLIVHAPGRRGAILRDAAEGPRLVVAADLPHVPRRIADWLKAEARRDLLAASSRHAAAMGTRFHRLLVRDPASRWGSCSAEGVLSYSWRLILAPSPVLDYVTAHEVAHLIEMNHSAGFWRLVKAHAPAAEEARRWLKANGARLHRYG